MNPGSDIAENSFKMTCLMLLDRSQFNQTMPAAIPKAAVAGERRTASGISCAASRLS
jgi:hypothetical protein